MKTGKKFLSFLLLCMNNAYTAQKPEVKNEIPKVAPLWDAMLQAQLQDKLWERHLRTLEAQHKPKGDGKKQNSESVKNS